MLWELGLLCPTRYLTEKDVIFPSDSFIIGDIERLAKYNFKLFIDGLEIYKPILFSKETGISRENEDFKVYFLPHFDKEVGVERLKFHGYIYSQRVKIKPTDLQGILIRIKDVAIGNYDKSILKYPREEGPIFSMISGEIFVEIGLENALNIDRNSFNETHPHYQELQFQLHKFIKEEVVNDIRERSKRRRIREKEEQIEKELDNLSKNIKNNWNIKVSFEIEQSTQNRLYLFIKNENKLIFFTKTKGWAKSEKERLFQMKTLITFTLIKNFSELVKADEVISEIIFGRK
jgi:hypothetical protein